LLVLVIFGGSADFYAISAFGFIDYFGTLLLFFFKSNILSTFWHYISLL